MWASKRWIVYLDSETAIEQAIEYVNQNPSQRRAVRNRNWSFVAPFQVESQKLAGPRITEVVAWACLTWSFNV